MGEDVRVLLAAGSAGTRERFAAELALSAAPRFLVESAADLAEALGRIDLGRIEVVVLDLSRSGEPGPEALIPIHARRPELAVVAVVEESSAESLGAQVLRAGAVDVLSREHAGGGRLRRCILYALERQRLLVDLRNRALVDELTGLHNARGFLALAPECLRLAQRGGKSLLFFRATLEDLRRTFETSGPDAGISLLRAAAGALRDTFRGSDVLARLGEDCFGILAVVDSAGASEKMLLRLRQRVARCRAAEGRPLALRMSVTPIESSAPVDFEEMLSRSTAPPQRRRVPRDGPD
jgi:two-component system cell cycle response regulator